MKILCLYNNKCAIPLFDWLKSIGHECTLHSERFTSAWCVEEAFDLAISYTYSFMVKQDVIDALNGNIVNIHNSLLPWNRGSDPNLWSIIDNSPRGVTLHYISSGVDKGEIIAQDFDSLDYENDTLKSSYERLNKIAIELFKKAFAFYEYWPDMKKEVVGKGTYHSDKQGAIIKQYISTYDMKVTDFINDYQKDK